MVFKLTHLAFRFFAEHKLVSNAQEMLDDFVNFSDQQEHLINQSKGYKDMSNNDQEAFELQVEVFKMTQQKNYKLLIPQMIKLQQQIEIARSQGSKQAELMKDSFAQTIKELKANTTEFFRFLHELRKQDPTNSTKKQHKS